MNNIILSMTSWKKRIHYLPQMLSYFLVTQNELPNRIIITLSENEFKNKENDLPIDLILLLKYTYIELNWITDNIYCHKRHEIFKSITNEDVLILDDDCYYQQNLIDECIKFKNTYSNSIANICLNYTSELKYNGKKMTYSSHVDTGIPKIQNAFLGQCFIPYGTFPTESFNYTYIRDTVCKKCDECWLKPFLIKNNIKIGSLPYSFPPMISGSQSDALVSENFKCEKNGLTLKNNNQNNVLDALPIEYKIAWKHIYSGYAI